jgi:hypothetical protein
MTNRSNSLTKYKKTRKSDYTDEVWDTDWSATVSVLSWLGWDASSWTLLSVCGEGGKVACTDTGVLRVSVVLVRSCNVESVSSLPTRVVMVEGEGVGVSMPSTICSGSVGSGDASSLRSFVGVAVLARRDGCILFVGRGGSRGAKSSAGLRRLIGCPGGTVATLVYDVP